jgi:hypothetical protein
MSWRLALGGVKKTAEDFGKNGQDKRFDAGETDTSNALIEQAPTPGVDKSGSGGFCMVASDQKSATMKHSTRHS